MKKLVFLVASFGFVALTLSSAFAVSPLRAVGVEAGYVSPDFGSGSTLEGTWVAGAYVDLGLPATNLYINPFVNYWNSSEGTGASEVSFRDWTVGANLKFTIPTSAVRVQPFVAGGAAAHLMNAAAGNIDASDTKFGFQAGAGLKIGVSQSANIVGSGWYHIVEDVNHWSMRAGLAWNI